MKISGKLNLMPSTGLDQEPINISGKAVLQYSHWLNIQNRFETNFYNFNQNTSPKFVSNVNSTDFSIGKNLSVTKLILF